MERTISDVVISKVKSKWYSLVEPNRLERARKTWRTEIRGTCSPLISIIIPTIGRWDLLHQRALKSIKHQTHKNVQIIVVHDSPKWQHYPDDPKLHWLVGPSHALNRGLEQVEGDYITRMDDDDEWRPKMLETMLKFAEEENFEFVSAAAKGPDGVILPYRHPLVGSVQTWLYRSYLKCFKYNLQSWRKEWDRNNEIDLYKRMHQAGVRMGYLPCVCCDIKPRPGVSAIGSKGWLDEYEMLHNPRKGGK